MRNNQRFRCRPLSQCLGAISIRASVALALAIACALVAFRQCASTSSTLLGDDNYTDSTFPTKLSLDVRTGPSNRVAQDFVVLGEVSGARKEKHFTGGSFGGGGQIRSYLSRTVAATGSLVESNPPKYLISGARNFKVSPFAEKVTVAPKWSWRLYSRGSCATSDYTVSSPVATPLTMASEAKEVGITLSPLPLNESTRARYALAVLASMQLQNVSRLEAPSIYAALDYLLESAAPSSDDPVANANYVRLLRRWHYLPVNDGTSPKNKDYLETFERHIEKRIEAARNIYYIYDNWRVVGDDVRLRWDDAADSNKDCMSDSGRSPSGWRRQTHRQPLAPILPTTNFLAHSLDEHSVDVHERHRVVQPKPLPFCVKLLEASDTEYTQYPVPYPYKYEERVVQNEIIRSGVDRSAAQKWEKDKNNWHLSRLRVACRERNLSDCNVNVFDVNGDTPLISLARVREKRQLPFSGPFGGYSGAMLTATDFRRVNRTIASLLINVGADPTVVNPILDSNALEGALDLIIEASYAGVQNRRLSGDAREHLLLVEDFLSYYERSGRGTIRDDYLSALKRVQAKAVDSWSRIPGANDWQLADSTFQRILRLPTRPTPSLCADDTAFWFREPGRQQENRAFNSLQGQDLDPTSIYSIGMRGKDYCCKQPE